MTTVNPRVSRTRPIRPTRPVHGYAFFEEFVLLYPLYALLFTENGLTVTHIGVLFVPWSPTSVLLTVSTGSLADPVPRHHLLAALLLARRGDRNPIPRSSVQIFPFLGSSVRTRTVR